MYGIEYGYHSFAGDSAFLGADEYHVHQFTGFGKFLFTPEPITPYMRIQTGVYQNVLVFGDESDWDPLFGLGFGGGIQLGRQGAVGGFADAVLHVAFDDTDSTNWVDIQAGLTILFGPRP